MKFMPTAPSLATRAPRRELQSLILQPPVPRAPQAERDQQFLDMLAGFRCSGGLNRAHDVGSWLEDSTRHAPGTLSRYIAHNEVIHVEWQLRTWLPMFQFDFTAMAPRVAIGLVLIDWAGAFEQWRMAHWFASAHAALQGRNPAQVLRTDPSLVIELARLEGPRAAPRVPAGPAGSLPLTACSAPAQAPSSRPSSVGRLDPHQAHASRNHAR